MSKVIWKYPLEITDRQELSVPAEAHFLHVGMQGEQLCLWARVDPTKPPMKVPVLIVGTGNPMPPDDDWAYHLGTVQQGPFVWHIFIGWEAYMERERNGA